MVELLSLNVCYKIKFQIANCNMDVMLDMVSDQTDNLILVNFRTFADLPHHISSQHDPNQVRRHRWPYFAIQDIRAAIRP